MKPSRDPDSPRCSVTVRGFAQDTATDRPASGGVVWLSHAHDVVGTAPVGADGSIHLSGQGLVPGRYEVTVLTPDSGSWRRSIDVSADDEFDLGTVQVQPVEFPPGVRGQLWDGDADRPIAAGRVRLERDGEPIGEVPVSANGAFAIEMTANRPTPPGDYDLVTDVAEYEPRRVPIHIIDAVLVYQLGRVELRRAQP